MSAKRRPHIDADIIYPDSDGKPIADNTLQFQWIVKIKENLEALFANQPDVFVAGDLLWYPVEGSPKIRRAPDAMVVFGRPKGYRGSYLQWREDNLAPHVVFEVLSPKNTASEMAGKHLFYQYYGVEEYYLYDPDDNYLSGWRRVGKQLLPIYDLEGWVSPRLGIRFQPALDTLRIFYPDGKPFLTFVEWK
jgi:Uma2 family endonuclease